MQKALKAMLTGIVDYAGLFPPAKLPLETACSNYAEYLRGDDRWLLGNFVVPVTMLDQLDSFESPCLIGSGDFESDIKKIFAYCDRHPDAAPFSYELKISSAEEVDKIRTQIAETKVPIEEVYFESPSAANEVIAAIRVFEFDSDTLLGFKLRCGGENAEDFPSTEFVARTLAACRGAPIKFTAGLHHPFRRWDDKIGVHMHGFVNVFVAGFFNQQYQFPVETIVAVLEDANPRNYRFDEKAFSWRDYELDAYDIDEMRELFPGFGSCSFDDPRNDLRAIGWM